MPLPRGLTNRSRPFTRRRRPTGTFWAMTPTERANEIEQIIARTVTATKTRSSSGLSSDVNLALEAEDPLLKKFKDLEGK